MEPDVVFVFGAGASYDDGAPLQDEILPIILSGQLKDIESSATGQAVCGFLRDNFAWDARAGIYPTLESVFGFLDYFINQNEHLSAAYPNAEIRAVKEGLIKLIHYVISEKSNRRAMVYKSFWSAVLRHNANLSILTLNYDTLLEEALQAVDHRAGIDYCIHLMDHGDAGGGPGAFRIMKGHGSLNWKYCSCCNQVLLTPWDTKIDLDAAGEKRYCCPVDGSELETLIIPPSHIKRISHPVVSQILNISLRTIRACRKVVFVGYSFPDADVHFKALFKKALINNQEIYVVNRTIDQKLKLNYTALAEGIKFIEAPFAGFIKNEPLVEELLSCRK